MRVIKSKYILNLMFILITLLMTSCSNSSSDLTVYSTTSNDDSCSYSMTVEISNGVDQIESKYVPCLSYTSEYTADGYCMIYDMIENINEIQSIDYSENISFTKIISLRISSIDVYDSQAVLIDTWTSWDEKTNLDSGSYFIKLHVSVSKTNCYKSGHAIFILNVE